MNRVTSIVAHGLLSVVTVAGAQSFDCTTTSGMVERTICDSPPLSRLDTNLSTIYRQYIEAHPKSRQAMIRQQRQWIKARNAQCGNWLDSADTRTDCLARSYRERITELVTKDSSPVSSDHITSCTTVLERYKALNADGDPSPLTSLLKAGNSGITLSEPLKLDGGVPDLIAWAEHQAQVDLPPGVMDDFEASAPGSMNTLDHLPGTDVFALHSNGGTMHCYSSTYFMVRNGFAFTIAAPNGIESDEGGGSCMVDRSFGTLDKTPAMFEEHYTYGPKMESSLTIVVWDQSRFGRACKIDFEFEPRVTEPTPQEPSNCSNSSCESMRTNAQKIVAAVQSDSYVRIRAIARLSEAQREMFTRSELAESTLVPGAQEIADPDSISQEHPLRLPHVQDDRLFVVSVGHRTIGWRTFSDWVVTFKEIVGDSLVERATFGVNMAKGRLTGAQITEK